MTQQTDKEAAEKFAEYNRFESDNSFEFNRDKHAFMEGVRYKERTMYVEKTPCNAHAAQQEEEIIDSIFLLPKVTRLEVIDKNGRSYVVHNAEQVELSYQDQGRTLKIFVKQ